MSAPTFGTPAAPPVERTIEREKGSGRPLIKCFDEAGAETLVPYDRASSYGKAIDSGGGLLFWAKCMVVKGTAMSPSIQKAAKPLDYYDEDGAGKKALIDLAEKAMDLAGAGNAAIEGTAMHSYTELIDKGQQIPAGVDDETLRDLEAYRLVTAGLTFPAVEQFVVVDEVRVAGTFDRIVQVPDTDEWPEWLRGKRVIGDLKSGKVEYIASILVQLALYANGKKYDPATGARTALDVDPTIGLVMHLPLGKATAELIAINLTVGWQGVLASQAARAFQDKAKLACKACNQGSGFYKNGNPCRSCKGVPRVPAGISIRKATAA